MAAGQDRKLHGNGERSEPDAAPSSAVERLVYTIPQAGRLLGLSRNAAYAAARRKEIPTIRIGRRLLVPKGPFHRMVELAGTGSAFGEVATKEEVET